MATVRLYGGEVLGWRDAGGVDHWLTGQHNMEIEGLPGGLWMPPFRLEEERIPGLPGAILRDVEIDPRDVRLPLTLFAASRDDLFALMEEVLDWFDPRRGPGALWFTGASGVTRELHARYTGGLEGAGGTDVHGVEWQRLRISLRVLDPFWYEVAERTATFTDTGSFVDWFPFPPLALTVNAIFAAATIDNPGKATAYPRWVLTGPARDPTLRNTATGEATTIAVTLGVGETLLIETRPEREEVVTGAGVNRYPQAGSVLWGLAPGATPIQVEIADTTAETRLDLAFNAPYLGPR